MPNVLLLSAIQLNDIAPIQRFKRTNLIAQLMLDTNEVKQQSQAATDV
jgi:hypothetical protein